MNRAPQNCASELRAVLALDPSLCDGLHLTHPCRLYSYEPWDGSTVAAFPAARHRGDMVSIALRITSGRARGGIVAPLVRRAAELHAARVPRDQAVADLREMYLEIAGLVRVLSSDQGGARHG